MKSIELHKWQSQAWNATERFIFMSAGVQSGKTTLGSVWIINESQKCGKGDYLIIAPTYRILNQSTLQKFRELVPTGWGTFNKAESTFITKDGKTFFLRSADKPESIEGITAQAIWADEASLMKADAWLMMQGRVSRTLGRILCTFTPIALNWIHKELQKDKERQRHGMESMIRFIQFRSVDSPWFPKEEYERARHMLTPVQFQMRYEGIFGKAEGLIYPDFGDDNIVDDFEIPDDWRRYGGMDFGYNNPFVALDAALSPDNVLYVYRERYASRCLLKEHAPFLDKKITYFADPSGLQEIKELRAMDFDVIKANNDVGLGILKVSARIRPQTDDKRSIRLKVFRSCIHTIDEFALYRYRQGQDKEILREEPEKKDDHCMDSVKYMVLGIDGSGPMEFVVMGDDSSMASALSGDNWERKMIEHEKKKRGQEKPSEEDEEIEKLRTPENARQYVTLISEHRNISKVAELMKVDEQLLRRWVARDREYINNVSRGGTGKDSGIEVL